MSDKMTYRYKAQFYIGRHYFEKIWQSVASGIMRLCSISTQIDHYRTYATMFSNELSKIARTSELILQKRELSCRPCPGIYGFMTSWLSFWCFEISFISWCVLIDTRLPWLWKFFINVGIATSFYPCPPLFPVELVIYYERLVERVVVFFLVNYQSEN